MKFNLQPVMQRLRDIAESHESDVIANAAANLASRLESVNAPFGYDINNLSDVDRQLISFAMNKG